jgi:hypothetical protein
MPEQLPESNGYAGLSFRGWPRGSADHAFGDFGPNERSEGLILLGLRFGAGRRFRATMGAIATPIITYDHIAHPRAAVGATAANLSLAAPS